MIKDSIIQFVCFTTNLGTGEFIAEWEPYAKKLHPKRKEPNLLEQAGNGKNKFRYLSRHEWSDRDFHFSFLNEKKSELFTENRVRVVQLGGYVPLPSEKIISKQDDDALLVAFISHSETSIDFYKQLPGFHQLDIYQAYYESCAYGYILEFHIAEGGAEELLLQLQQRPGIETGVYKECAVTA
jgi:hypothetical protein